MRVDVVYMGKISLESVWMSVLLDGICAGTVLLLFSQGDRFVNIEKSLPPFLKIRRILDHFHSTKMAGIRPNALFRAIKEVLLMLKSGYRIRH